MITEPTNLHHELQKYLSRQVHWKTVGFRLLVGLCLLALVVWFGRHAVDQLKALETWTASHGLWGKLTFLGIMVVFTSLFVPDTLLAVAAGALYGLGWGSLLTFVGAILTAVLNFWLARNLFRPRIEAMLQQHPKLQAIVAAAKREGLRLQLLLRLAPINPVTVSYVMGASGVRFSTFLLATIGLIPGLFVEVYFGYLASHVTKVAGSASEHSTLHTLVTVVGFVVCIVLIVLISRIATKALKEVENEALSDVTVGRT